MLGVGQSRGPKLFGREIISEEFQPMCCWYLNVTDRQTDGRTDGRLTVALPRSALASRGKNLYANMKRYKFDAVISSIYRNSAANSFFKCENVTTAANCCHKWHVQLYVPMLTVLPTPPVTSCMVSSTITQPSIQVLHLNSQYPLLVYKLKSINFTYLHLFQYWWMTEILALEWLLLMSLYWWQQCIGLMGYQSIR